MSQTKSWFFVSTAKEGYPINLDGDERLLWFAYCASSYIRKNERKPVAIPFSEARIFPFVNGCRMHARWRSDADICPEEVTFVYDLKSFKDGIKELSFEPPGDFLDRRDKTYRLFIDNHKDGDVIAVFKVSQWRQVGDIGIPHLWELVFSLENSPIINGMRCVGRTEDATNTADLVQLPLLPQVAEITDSRVRDVLPRMNYITYKISNGIIPKVSIFVPNLSSSNPVPHFVGSGGAYQTDEGFRKPRLIFTILLALLASGPLFFLFQLKKDMTKRINKQT